MSKEKIKARWLFFGKDKYTYDTIDELVNKSMGLAVGEVVTLNGYYSADDGATHKRVIADTDDGSGVQLRSGKWACIVHNGEVNVSWFGTKGDGVTDDTETFKKVMLYNCNITASKKNYLITDTLIFDTKGKHKFIDFKMATIKFTPSTSKFLIITKGYEAHIKNLVVVGNYIGSGIKLGDTSSHSFSPRLENCFLQYLNIGLQVFYSNGGYLECETSGCNTGVLFDGTKDVNGHLINMVVKGFNGKKGFVTSDSCIELLGNVIYEDFEDVAIELKGSSHNLNFTGENMKGKDMICSCTASKIAITTVSNKIEITEKRTNDITIIYGGQAITEDKRRNNWFEQPATITGLQALNNCYMPERLEWSDYKIDSLVDMVRNNFIYNYSGIIIFEKATGQISLHTEMEDYSFFFKGKLVKTISLGYQKYSSFYFNLVKSKKIVFVFELTQAELTQAQQLNTLYHGEKMKQEGVYEDYISYMDDKTAYDKQQRKLEQDRQLAYEEALKENPELTYEEFMSVQPMLLNIVEEPQPSENLKKFMDKYL